MSLDISELRKARNIAEFLDHDELQSIGRRVVRSCELDEESRAEWQELVDKAMDIAKQTMEVKNHPFTRSSNVKYPLITQAAIDFAARMYPELIQNDRVVKASVVGADPEDKKLKRAVRVSKHMSYQLLHQMPDFEDGVDKLLHILPILGTVFKKTYYDSVEKRPVSELCSPDKIIINYETQSLEEARRISHILVVHTNDIVERIRAGLFVDCDVDALRVSEGYDLDDEDAPIELIEQHCYLDLDEDGYQEPYIVTCHKESGTVLRIMHRFKKVHRNKNGEVARIEPLQYFTDYHFIRAPDGGFYSTGLGTLLYPLNAAINTLINQLIDAGTLANVQGGFLGRGLRLKNGEFKMKLGEWKVLDAASGTNLAQNIVPMPVKEPSGTLFQLLGLLIDVGKDLISSHDLMQGKGQTQNVAAATVLAMVEQGMKVYNAITKRLYRSLRKEFIKIYELNQKYLKQADYVNILDDEPADAKADYATMDLDILPVSDPNMASDAQRLAKAQAIMSVPTLDPYAATRYYLEALQLDQQRIEKLLPAPDPQAPPPPEHRKLLAEVDKLAAEAKLREAESENLLAASLLEETKLTIQRDDALVRAEESAARIMKMKQDSLATTAKISLAGAKADHEATIKDLNALHQREKDEVDLSIRAMEASAKLDTESEDENED
jgi:chaperonin GroES